MPLSPGLAEPVSKQEKGEAGGQPRAGTRGRKLALQGLQSMPT